MWEFHTFSITQILQGINIWDSRSAISVILTHLEALNFDFYEFLHLLKVEFYQSVQKRPFLELLDSPKLFSRKI